MKKEEAIKQLQDFNKAGVELFRLSFVKKMQEPNCGYSMNFEKGKGITCIFRGPDDEAVKAFCNDLRKFIQKNDYLHYGNLKKIYDSDFVTAEERASFYEILSQLKQFTETSTNHSVNGELITYARALEVFLYGKISHMSDHHQNRKTYEKWEGFPPTYVSLKNEFMVILYEYMRVFINNFMISNNRVLERLGYPRIEIMEGVNESNK
ncbi:MAG: hypothetical protein WC492_03210 [Candidatus Micrarchaeia archaeon]